MPRADPQPCSPLCLSLLQARELLRASHWEKHIKRAKLSGLGTICSTSVKALTQGKMWLCQGRCSLKPLKVLGPRKSELLQDE